jgi:hypothetical protein
VRLLQPLLPHLEELYLSANSLGDLPAREPGPSTTTPTSASEATVNEPTVFNGTIAAATASTATEATSALPAFFARLQLLDMSGCGLRDWRQVLSLGSLPRLRELMLDDNPLAGVLGPGPGAEAKAEAEAGASTGTSTSALFPLLERVSLSSTRLTQWTDVDALQLYPKLSSLRLSHVPLFKGRGASEVSLSLSFSLSFSRSPSLSLSPAPSPSPSPSPSPYTFYRFIPLQSRRVLNSFSSPLCHCTAFMSYLQVRPEVIARLPNLSFFNGSNVSGRERADAERSYVRSVLRKVRSWLTHTPPAPLSHLLRLRLGFFFSWPLVLLSGPCCMCT